MKERRERERKVGREEGRKKKEKEAKAPKRQMKLKELETKQYRTSESCSGVPWYLPSLYSQGHD